MKKGLEIGDKVFYGRRKRLFEIEGKSISPWGEVSYTIKGEPRAVYRYIKSKELTLAVRDGGEKMNVLVAVRKLEGLKEEILILEGIAKKVEGEESALLKRKIAESESEVNALTLKLESINLP